MLLVLLLVLASLGIGLTGAAIHLPEKRNKNAGVETKIELVEDKEKTSVNKEEAPA